MIWLFLFFLFGLQAQIKDVEAFLKPLLDDSAILRTVQITIPGYARSYNPSLIAYEGGYLLSFRYVSQFPKTVPGHRVDASFVGLVKLDKELNVLPDSVQLLPIQSYANRFSLTAEDARLLRVNDKIFLFFNDLPPPPATGFSMYFAEIREEGGVFALKGPAKRLQYPFAIPVEKNWSPFVVGRQLYVIYSDAPRLLLEVDEETGLCREVRGQKPDLQWNLGLIRGGTPALLCEGHFLTFFHSSFPVDSSKGRAYVMGAYLFAPDPPFAIGRVTPYPLGKLSDYAKDNEAKVIFPGGIVVEGERILVAWGKGDKQIQITFFDPKRLLESMVPP